MASPDSSSSQSIGRMSLEDLEKVFGRYDTDGDGRISAAELGEVLRALGSDASPQEVQAMMAEMDANNDGCVDLDEFTAFHSRRSAGAESELRDAFRVYDLDSNGKISAKELHLVLKRLGEKCSVKDCSRMIKPFDADGDGNVNYEEFKKMMRNGGGGGGSAKAGEKSDRRG